MQKKKIFNIEGSNIEMLGSNVEKKVREAAGGKEKAWAKAGKKPGLEIWRIEQFKVKAWPKKDYGKFYEGDSYIILWTYKKKDTDTLAWDLHFWLGSSTTQDEAGTAAYKTVELDDFLGGAPIQHREVCGRESPSFLSYFSKNGGIELLAGGADSGFNHVKPEEYNARLLHLKGRKNVRITQVELSGKSLRAGDCFVLDGGLQIFQWQGKNSNRQEKIRAAQYVANLNSERSGKPQVTVIDQMDKDYPEEFWELLGGSCEISEEDGGDDAWEQKTDKLMFQLSDAGGKLEFVAVGQGKTCVYSKLDTNDVFIVDVGSELYVWVGKGASAGEKAKAMSQAQQYLTDYKRPAWLPVSRIIEGSENERFTKALQPKVHRKLKKSTGGPKIEQKGEMGCYLTVNTSSNGSMFLNWSQKDVTGAVGYFKPTKSVPAFKFKTKGGKSELTRETDSNRKNYFTGWVNYVKLAKEYKSTLMYKTSDVALWSLVGSKPSQLPRGVLADISNVQVIAAVSGKSSGAVFGGLKTIDKGTFINKAQEQGAALTLS